jgi:arsenate reductase
VFTVCDQAGAEECPVWPGQPITAFEGSDDEKRRFFFRIYSELENRIKIFTSLRMEALDSFTLRQRVREIGKIVLPEERR